MSRGSEREKCGLSLIHFDFQEEPSDSVFFCSCAHLQAQLASLLQYRAFDCAKKLLLATALSLPITATATVTITSLYSITTLSKLLIEGRASRAAAEVPSSKAVLFL